MADRKDLSATGFSSVLENLNKKTGSNYCAICDVKAYSETNFFSHIAGRKHQLKLRRIEKAGFENWAKTEAKKGKRNASKSQKSKKKKNVSKNLHTASSAPEQLIPEEQSKRLQKVSTTNEGGGADRKLSSSDCSQPKEALHSEISNDSNRCSVANTSLVVPPGNNQVESVSPVFSASEMKPRGSFRVQPNSALLPSPRFNSRHSPANFHGDMFDSRPPYWQCYPLQANYRGRYQNQYGRASRTFASAGTPSFKQQNVQRGMKSGDVTSPKSKSSWKGGSQNEVSGQTRSFSGSKTAHVSERSKDNQIPRSGRNMMSYQKSSDGSSRYGDFSDNIDPHMGTYFDVQQRPFTQGERGGTAYPQNSRDSRQGVQSEREHRHRSYSPSGSEKRRTAEKQRDSGSETFGSRCRSNPRHSSDEGSSRNDDLCDGAEVRSSKGVRNEKVRPRETIECSRMSQNKNKEVGQQSSKTNETVTKKSVTARKLTDCDNTGSQPSKSENLATPKSPTFSNVTMQRMNARLHSFTKYGKMPTSGQIRHLAVSASPAQERRDGKLQEWSKKIESHHNLTAQDKELINRLVNYPCSRREQKKLEYYLREHARSRKKLTLPRFNLQLSGMEDCKDPSGVDDNVSSMVTEVVDCLPEDVLNSLINALNSDADEYIAITLPVDTCTSPGSKGGKKNADEEFFVTLDEVGGNSSCDETADCSEQQHNTSGDSTAALCHSSETELLPNNQNPESSDTVNIHTSPVKATEHLSRGSSLEICESVEILGTHSSKADQQQTVSVEVRVKEESLKDRNIQKHSDINKLSHCEESRNATVTQNSENPVKTLPNLENVGIQVKNERLDPQSVDVEIIEVSPVAPCSSSTLSSLKCVSSVEEPADRHLSVKQEGSCPSVTPEVITLEEGDSSLGSKTVSGVPTFDRKKCGLGSTVKPPLPPSVNCIRPYPGLSYIMRPFHRSFDQEKENTSGATQANKSLNSGNVFAPSSVDHNHGQGGAQIFHSMGSQRFQYSTNFPAAVAANPVIKVEHSSDIPSGDGENEEFSLPKISSVTSIRNSENFMGKDFALLTSCSEASFKQEPVSPTRVTVVTLTDNAEEGSERNSKANERTPSTEPSVSAAVSNGSSHSTEQHHVAAAAISTVDKASSLLQKEDGEKISEVSSSTGTLLDEVSLVLQDSMHHATVGRNDGASPDLIRELLSITSAEEKLVQQASEAERTIAQLTASLEEWKRKKYEIEHEQMKLRMKRQELLLLNATKGSIPHNKYSKATFHSAANNKTSEHDSSSDEEKRSTVSMRSSSILSLEKYPSDSDSSSSHSLNRTSRHSVSNFRKKRGKANHNTNKVHNLSNKRPLDDDHSDSAVDFTNKRKKKCKSSSRLFLKDEECSSERNIHKKRCLDTSPRVVLKPLELNSGDSGGKAVLNNNDDIIILEDSPDRSLRAKEAEESSSSDDGSVIIQGEVGSITSQKDVIASTPCDVVNIGTLRAHDGAVIDLKVYDGYLYSCSLDCTAKRFSLRDPTNDNTSYEGHQKAVTSVFLSPKKQVYTTCLDTFLRCFVPETGDIVNSFEMKSGISCSCAGGGMLYLGLNSGEVLFFGFKTKKVIYELKSASCTISRLATVTQGAQRLLCVVANDGIVSLYDTATGLLLRCLDTRVRPPCFIQIYDDCVYITTSEKSIVIHNLLSGKLVRMVNWAASSTGLEIINNYILTSSYDGLIRCHNINQDMVSHSVYYGAGSAMVMSMTAYKEWVITANRKGIIEAFKFDPSKQLACQYGRCRLKYGRECDVLHHVTIDHLPCLTIKTKRCPWIGCTHEFTPRTTIEGKQEHVKEHVISCY